MKILKDAEHSLLLRPFGAAGKPFLAVTVMALFDLGAPGVPLDERELWDTVPKQLPAGTPLDAGLPKARGEFLLAGRTWTPGGRPRQAQRVSVRFGPLTKHLEVFGDRWWDAGRITEPVPFTSLPLDWSRAFGGEGDPRNPAGMGLHPVASPGAGSRVPLPNLELPGRLVGSPLDRPEPAGFGPRDLLHPGRQRRAGTWDERWRRERWPGLPDDLDYRFFNVAPEDQWLEGFIPAGTPFELRHLHPEHRVLTGAVPGYPFRAFVTRRLEPPEAGEEGLRFEEVSLRTDTLWLFPSIGRGVVIQRGTCEILDDEAEDVIRVLVVTEPDPGAPRSLEACLDLQRRRLAAPELEWAGQAEETAARLAESREEQAGIPRWLDDLRKRANDEVPLVPRSPAERRAADHALLAGAREHQERLEAAMAPVRAGSAPMSEHQLGGMATGRAALAALEGQLDDLAAMREDLAGQAEAGVAAARGRLAEVLEGPAGDEVRRRSLNLEVFPGPAEGDPWRARGFAFAVEALRTLEQSPAVQAQLRALGLKDATFQRAWLGWNPEARTWPRQAWGLAPDPGGEPLRVPPGLVLPRFRGKELVALRILQAGDWAAFPGWEPLLLEGSIADPLFLPAPFQDGPVPVLRVATEPEALLLDQFLSDRCSILVRAAPGEALAGAAAQALREAPCVLAILPADAEKADQEPWRAAGAIPLPLPRGGDLFAARRSKVDLLTWIRQALPRTGPEPADPAQSTLDSARLNRMKDRLLDESAARRAAAFREAGALRAGAMERFRRVAEEHGVTLPEPEAGTGAGDSIEDAPALLARALAKARATPGAEAGPLKAHLDQVAAEAGKLCTDGVARYRAGMASLAEAQAQAEMLPGGAAPLSREAVIARRAEGGHLRGARLEGLDLSGLDLGGMDFSQARCQGACFRDAMLTGARFARADCQDADFTGAGARSAVFEDGVLNGARFPGADLEGASFAKCILNNSDFTGVRAAGIRLHQCILDGARLDGAILTGADLSQSILDRCTLEDARLDQAALDRCTLGNCQLDRADFTRAALHDTLLDGCTGSGVRFAGADLDRLRSGEGTALPGADFAGATLNGACLRRSAFPGATFAGCRLDDAVVEACDLRGANLRGARARRARFKRSNLEGARMQGLDLLHGSLRKARLVRTDLAGSNLHGVDFHQAVVGGTRTDGANVERTLLQGRQELLP